jgi:hypothetical protein
MAEQPRSQTRAGGAMPNGSPHTAAADANSDEQAHRLEQSRTQDFRTPAPVSSRERSAYEMQAQFIARQTEGLRPDSGSEAIGLSYQFDVTPELALPNVALLIELQREWAFPDGSPAGPDQVLAPQPFWSSRTLIGQTLTFGPTTDEASDAPAERVSLEPPTPGPSGYPTGGLSQPLADTPATDMNGRAIPSVEMSAARSPQVQLHSGNESGPSGERLTTTTPATKTDEPARQGAAPSSSIFKNYADDYASKYRERHIDYSVFSEGFLENVHLLPEQEYTSLREKIISEQLKAPNYLADEALFLMDARRLRNISTREANIRWTRALHSFQKNETYYVDIGDQSRNLAATLPIATVHAVTAPLIGAAFLSLPQHKRQELKHLIYDISITKPSVFNNAHLLIARSKRFPPAVKHMVISYIAMRLQNPDLSPQQLESMMICSAEEIYRKDELDVENRIKRIENLREIFSFLDPGQEIRESSGGRAAFAIAKSGVSTGISLAAASTGPLAGAAVSAVWASHEAAADAGLKAKKEGFDVQEQSRLARLASGAGAAKGALSNIPAGKYVANRIKNGIDSKLAEILFDGIRDGAITFGENIYAGRTYDPARAPLDGVARDTAIGAASSKFGPSPSGTSHATKD